MAGSLRCADVRFSFFSPSPSAALAENSFLVTRASCKNLFPPALYGLLVHISTSVLQHPHPHRASSCVPFFQVYGRQLLQDSFLRPRRRRP